MIKIIKPSDLSKIDDVYIKAYIKKLIADILNEYDDCCPDCSLEAIGAIYYLEEDSDIDRYLEMGLTSPLCESHFEWIENIGKYCNGCVVINNDLAINIIGKNEYFEKL